jgi:hypothetical protein
MFQRLLTTAAVLFALSATPTFSQVPKAEIFGGYSWARQGDINIGKGWNGSVAGNFNRWFGVEGDISGHYYSRDLYDVSGVNVEASVSFLTYRFGPRFSFRSEDNLVTPFAHFLVGGVRTKGTGSGSVAGTTFNVSQSSNDFAGLAGGGIDIGRGSVAVRAIQVDYSMLRAHDLFGTSGTSNGVRISTGVVFRLK